jgi:hypothetical protein
MQTLKVVSLIFAASMFAAACGDSKSSLNPTAPSAVSADTLSAEAGGDGEYSATAKPNNGNGNGNNGNGNGNGGNGNGNGNGNQPRTPTNTSPAPTSPVPPGKAKVDIEGLISAVGGNSITVRGQMVTVTPDTVIRHGNRRFEFSDLNVGDRVHVRAARVTGTDGAAAAASTLEATEIQLQNPGDGDGEGEEPSALVSVAAFDASASETGINPGTFRLTRAGTVTQLASALTVSFALTGTALNGTDYENVLLSATFPAGEATVDVVVTPRVDALVEGAETITLTLTTVPAPFELGSPVAATVDLSDGVNPLVSVTASDPSASESGDTGTFTFTRSGDLTAELVVTVQFSGSATPGFDYAALPTTVNFLAGEMTATMTVTPMSDAATDPSDTVIVTAVDGPGYDLGLAPTATVTILGS